MMRKSVKACQNCQNTGIQIRSALKGVAYAGGKQID